MDGMVRCAPGCWLDRPTHFLLRCRFFTMLCACATLATVIGPTQTHAVTSESPEVRKLVDQGLSFLENNTSNRLGGKCLIALAFLKNGASLEHHRIREAIDACKAVTNQEISQKNNYSIGLAIIFLAELKSEDLRPQLTRYANELAKRQKPHGGWGYPANPQGDTSQTQYAVLSFWELLQSGISPKVHSVESCLNWLSRTQDPGGAWGYSGKDPGGTLRIKQTETSASMTTAGLGSTMILANVLGLVSRNSGLDANAEKSGAPAALKRASNSNTTQIKQLNGNGVNRQRLLESIKSGQARFKEFFRDENEGYPCYGQPAKFPYYVLYSIERCKSFEELLSGNATPEPDWYLRGYEYLKKQQTKNGHWNGRSGHACSTAFAVLFLLRSTQKSIKASLGEGTLVGGRGLQADLSRMKLQRGRLIATAKATKVSDLLGILNNSAPEELEQLLNNPDALRFDNAGPEDSRRLQQIIKSGVPEARIMSVQMLAQLRDLDHVPTLLYAMTDPDKRVVREARDALRFISRRFGGFGLADDFSDSERYDVIDKWKRWYRRVRPDAPPLP